MPTKIEWTEETWNPVTGCSKVSPGCEYCYAERLSLRYGWSKKPWTAPNALENVVLHHERIEQPLHWRKPRLIFTCSMADLFHEMVPDSFLLDVFRTMRRTPHHTYQILTKRATRARAFLSKNHDFTVRPLPNVWLGVSAEDQRRADERIPVLLDTPAAVRFVSVEPLLGPVDLRRYIVRCPSCDRIHLGPCEAPSTDAGPVAWVIAGGESGGPADRRLVMPCPYHDRIIKDRPHPPGCPWCSGTNWMPTTSAIIWARALRNQCVSAGVPFFWKQWGGPSPKAGGRLLDGRTWDEMPEVRR